MFWYISFVTGIYWYIFVSFVTNIFEEALPPVLSQISFQLHLGLPHCNSAYADYIHVFILGILSLLPSHVWVFPIPCSTMQVSFSSLASPWGWIHLPWTWRKESSNTDQLVGLTFLQGHSHGILPWSSLKRLHLVLLKSRAAIWCSSSLLDTELHNPWSLQPRLPPAFLVDKYKIQQYTFPCWILHSLYKKLNIRGDLKGTSGIVIIALLCFSFNWHQRGWSCPQEPGLMTVRLLPDVCKRAHPHPPLYQRACSKHSLQCHLFQSAL